MTAVSVSVHDKIDLSMAVAVGSSIQISLFLIPFAVTLGWMMDKPLSLLFDEFESIVLFLSVILVNCTLADGKSNWLEGWLLMLMCKSFLRSLIVSGGIWVTLNVVQSCARLGSMCSARGLRGGKAHSRASAGGGELEPDD